MHETQMTTFSQKNTQIPGFGRNDILFEGKIASNPTTVGSE